MINVSSFPVLTTEELTKKMRYENKSPFPGLSFSDIEAMYGSLLNIAKLPAIPFIDPETKTQKFYDGKGLYIEDRTSDEGLAYLWSNTIIKNPSRSKEDCLIFSIFKHDISIDANTSKAIYREMADASGLKYTVRLTAWVPLLRWGPTFSSFWEVIDRIKNVYKITDPQEILNFAEKQCITITNDVIQHKIDIQHYMNNATIFTAIGLTAVLVGAGALAAAAVPSVTSVGAVAASPALDTALPISVTVVSGEAVAETAALSVPVVSASAGITETVLAGVSAGSTALVAAAGQELGNLFNTTETKNEVKTENTQKNNLIPIIGIGASILGAIILLFKR